MTALPSDSARTLLRRLRDLNLRAGPIALSSGVACLILGCLSKDAPAESGVRYLLRGLDGREQTLVIGWGDSALSLELVDAISGLGRRTSVPVVCDSIGRACLPAIGARVRPDSTDPRELEHFLRRLVRAGFPRA
jgi:hypothetical protein